MKDEIVRAAKKAFRDRLLNSSDVSANTRNAQAIGRQWRTACWELDHDRFSVEETIHPGLNQKIDVVDRVDRCAYEFKVSGKNATSEFYKDVVKVILWNETRSDKLTRLVFITEEEWGKKYLETEMPHAFIKYLARSGLEVEILYLKSVQP